jgi:hypothetical protein
MNFAIHERFVYSLIMITQLLILVNKYAVDGVIYYSRSHLSLVLDTPSQMIQ